MNKRLIHIKYGINFNNICLKEGLQPTFANIYIYTHLTGIITTVTGIVTTVTGIIIKKWKTPIFCMNKISLRMTYICQEI